MATLASLPGGDMNAGIIAKATNLANIEVAKLAPVIATALTSVEQTFIADMAAAGLTFTGPTQITTQSQIVGWLTPIIQSIIQQAALANGVSALTTAGLI